MAAFSSEAFDTAAFSADAFDFGDLGTEGAVQMSSRSIGFLGALVRGFRIIAWLLLGGLY